MPPTPVELVAAFAALAGRPRQVLVMRLLEARSRGDLASFYGISGEASDVLFFRSMSELDWALTHPPGTPPVPVALPFAEEAAAATALGAALARGEEGASQGLARPLELCRAVAAHREELQRAVIPPPAPVLSPRQQFWDVARRVAWLALVIGAAVLYSRWTAR